MNKTTCMHQVQETHSKMKCYDYDFCHLKERNELSLSPHLGADPYKFHLSNGKQLPQFWVGHLSSHLREEVPVEKKLPDWLSLHIMATDRPFESENRSADTLFFELVVSFTLGEMHTAESDTALTGKGILMKLLWALSCRKAKVPLSQRGINHKDVRSKNIASPGSSTRYLYDYAVECICTLQQLLVVWVYSHMKGSIC